MRKKDIPSAYENYLQRCQESGLLKIEKKASAPIPEKIDEKILDFCERLRQSNLHKLAQEIEENFINYKGLSAKLESLITQNMGEENHPTVTQLIGLPEEAKVLSMAEKQRETAQKVLSNPLNKAASFIMGDDQIKKKANPLAAGLIAGWAATDGKDMYNRVFNRLNFKETFDKSTYYLNVFSGMLLQSFGKNKFTSSLTSLSASLSQYAKAIEAAKISSQDVEYDTFEKNLVTVKNLSKFTDNCISQIQTSMSHFQTDEKIEDVDYGFIEMGEKAIKYLSNLKTKTNSLVSGLTSIRNKAMAASEKSGDNAGGVKDEIEKTIPKFTSRSDLLRSKFVKIRNIYQREDFSSNPQLAGWFTKVQPVISSLASAFQGVSTATSNEDFTKLEADINNLYGQFASIENRLNGAKS